MRALAMTLTAAVLTGCAATADTSGSPEARFDPSASQWEGWVRFSGEEFQLYPRQVDVRRPFSRPCVSGALPRDLQRQAVQDLSGQRVRITGRAIAWQEDQPGFRYDQQGSNITNTCGGEAIILADRMVAIP